MNAHYLLPLCLQVCAGGVAPAAQIWLRTQLCLHRTFICTLILQFLCLLCVFRYALVALRLRPNFGMAHYQAATCYERLGMLQQALEEAEKALEMAW